eukprot:CAMPEP_0116896978 /NCGR_PEP_ID=MMETSP0467-20121206/6094_1 /TAXON_ID=283647 /ORGANISM="Mesodinium pulex, Strain SPMC105" /LENGTH=41 /DNA_ID= /DNA_START= /DNA_END= /DNA_ORIENTATION=
MRNENHANVFSIDFLYVALYCLSFMVSDPAFGFMSFEIEMA